MFYNKKKYVWQRKAIVVAFLLCVVGIFYFSWLPDARLKEEIYLPLWLRNWSNTYFNLRTAVPFIILGFLLEAWQSITDKPSRKIKVFPLWVLNNFIVTVIVCIAEGGQFFILDRHPDVMDVAFGILGSLLGSVLYYVFGIFVHLIFIKNEK